VGGVCFTIAHIGILGVVDVVVAKFRYKSGDVIFAVVVCVRWHGEVGRGVTATEVMFRGVRLLILRLVRRRRFS
jgi:hypothetical protein